MTERSVDELLDALLGADAEQARSEVFFVYKHKTARRSAPAGIWDRCDSAFAAAPREL
jgi:hypothetical protein